VQEHRELLEALAALVDMRDGHMGKHAREVARWSRQLATVMGFDPYQVNLIEAAALVHDIGKVGVPDGILHKPEGLDDAEWEVIRKHPEWGATVVGRVASLRAVADLVEQHQEWFDGRGYPKGLAESEIEVGARVISVVDTFHAIVNDRPYRQAQPVATALTELERMAGSQFDPKLVDGFIGLVRRGEIVVTPRNESSESDDIRKAS
jgi:putative nucleotidyltransferase with HDIG domain